MEEDNYVICVAKDRASNILVIGKKYHVEEAFNFTSENFPDKDSATIIMMIQKYPNPFFYLEEFHNTCSCCGERIYFWHGLFQTKKQIEDAKLSKETSMH